MEHSVGVDNVERSQRGHVLGIEHRSLRDRPFWVVDGETSLHLARARHAVGVVVERMHSRALTARRKAEQSAAAADVQKGAANEVRAPQHREQGRLGCHDTGFVNRAEKRLPVPTELEPFARIDLVSMRGRTCVNG